MFDVQQLSKHYEKAGQEIAAVHDASFRIESGEFVVLHGPSGSGKSTLLLMLGGMLTPTSGTVCHQDADLYRLSRRARNRYRRATIGFLFQKFYLMPYLSVYDNIRMPLLLRGAGASAAAKIANLAERLHFEGRLRHRPAELSVGEQQRVAMARALIAEPDVLLADEPTGNLDKANRDIMAECFQDENRRGRTIVIATHEETLLALGQRRLFLEDGKLGSGEDGAQVS